jgi:drug/metabolite transporter (DMT)-like permease
LIGVFYVTRPEGGFEQLDFGSDYLKGVLFGLTGGLFSSGVIISVRYLRDEYNGLTQLFWQSAISLFFLSPFAISVPREVLTANLPVLMLFGVLVTGIGAVFYIRGVTGVNAITGSILTLLEPVSCIFFDYTVLGNPIHRGMLIGCIFILAAATVISLDDSVSLRKLIPWDKTAFSKKTFVRRKITLRAQNK